MKEKEHQNKVSLIKGKRSPTGDTVRTTESRDHPTGNFVKPTRNTEKRPGRNYSTRNKGIRPRTERT